jgi:hypothetical protein
MQLLFANMGQKTISLKVVPTQKMGEDHAKGKKVIRGNMIANPYGDNHKRKDTS